MLPAKSQVLITCRCEPLPGEIADAHSVAGVS